MSDPLILPSEEEEKPRRPKLRLITGGKGPPGPPHDVEDWLYTLRNRVIFIAKEKTDTTPWCKEFHVLHNEPDHVCYLGVKDLDGSTTQIWAETEVFSRKYKLVEIVYAPDPEEEQENEQRDRAHSAQRVGDNEDAPGEHSGRQEEASD